MQRSGMSEVDTNIQSFTYGTPRMYHAHFLVQLVTDTEDARSGVGNSEFAQVFDQKVTKFKRINNEKGMLLSPSSVHD